MVWIATGSETKRENARDGAGRGKKAHMCEGKSVRMRGNTHTYTLTFSLSLSRLCSSFIIYFPSFPALSRAYTHTVLLVSFRSAISLSRSAEFDDLLRRGRASIDS